MANFEVDKLVDIIQKSEPDYEKLSNGYKLTSHRPRQQVLNDAAMMAAEHDFAIQQLVTVKSNHLASIHV